MGSYAWRKRGWNRIEGVPGKCRASFYVGFTFLSYEVVFLRLWQDSRSQLKVEGSRRRLSPLKAVCMSGQSRFAGTVESSLKRRADVERSQLLRAFTDLFVTGAAHQSAARADFAPARVAGTLARPDDIAVAGPWPAASKRLQLRHLGIAATRSRPHLAAIASRPGHDGAVWRNDRRGEGRSCRCGEVRSAGGL
jgi:hypothetical protein